MPGPQSWSIDPTQNDVIDPAIFLAEGQSPPTLNNAVRAVMAGIAGKHLDESGSLTAAGTANALTLTTNQGFAAADLARPFEIAFTVANENTGPVTLSVDGTAAKSIFRRSGLPVGPGDVVPGPRYRVTRMPGFGDSYLLSEPALEAAGTIKTFGSEAAVPKGWVVCDGRLLSRTSYAALFQAIAGIHGTGDGSTTFAVPDLRGRVPAGADAMGGTAANRLTGAGGVGGGVGSNGGTEAYTLTAAQLAAHSHTGTAAAAGGTAATTTGAAGAHDHGSATGSSGGHTHTASADSAGAHVHTGSTDSQGSHTHSIKYRKQAIYGSGGSLVAVSGLASDTPTNNTDLSEAGGTHTHGLTIDSAGAHGHTVTVNAATAHTHTITAAADHSHSIPAVADHTHSVTTNNAGSGQAHPNMPPALVIVFAIKA